MLYASHGVKLVVEGKRPITMETNTVSELELKLIILRYKGCPIMIMMMMTTRTMMIIIIIITSYVSGRLETYMNADFLPPK